MDNFSESTELYLIYGGLSKLPEDVSNISNLTHLHISHNGLPTLPEWISNLTNLTKIYAHNNRLNSLPESIGNLTNLTELHVDSNQLTSLPASISNLTNLTALHLNRNPLTDLSILQNLPQLKGIKFFNIELPRRYWSKFSQWNPEWLLDEWNAEIRRTLIEQVGYEKICQVLKTLTLDTWREYTLLIIADFKLTDNNRQFPRRPQPTILLKMTCPSTGHIHVLRVPPEMKSAEEAITWVNHGIHPDKFAVQT
jgi:leucine-rich repeat protein SHOC2